MKRTHGGSIFFKTYNTSSYMIFIFAPSDRLHELLTIAAFILSVRWLMELMKNSSRHMVNRGARR